MTVEKPLFIRICKLSYVALHCRKNYIAGTTVKQKGTGNRNREAGQKGKTKRKNVDTKQKSKTERRKYGKISVCKTGHVMVE